MLEHYASFEDTESYASLFAAVREDGPALREQVVQCAWYDQLFVKSDLATAEGMALRIVSPGWWNHGEGPDFKGAQIQFGDTLRTGDVEVHLDHGAWKQHGHHADPRYDNVILVAVMESRPPPSPPRTSKGRTIACLLLTDYVDGDLLELSRILPVENYPYVVDMSSGYCAALSQSHGVAHIQRFLILAGEWRLLQKARDLGNRMARVGPDQAIYELFLTACGFSRYKDPFLTIARQLPYERVAQLAERDPALLEAALLQIAGLLPQTLPGTPAPVPHFDRLASLRREHLPGLRALPLNWKRTGVRPNNYPERRLAGAARFLARTSREGLARTLQALWRNEVPPVKRRRSMEALFPNAMGFWAEHCTWMGARLKQPQAPIGPGRVRSIIGNVFVPATLAMAREARDRALEEKVHAFFAALPQESGNQIVKIMIPRVFGQLPRPRMDFRTQQGLIQVYQDWCQPNPSCRNCPVISYLDDPGPPVSST